jgi:hypothetical protein
MNEFITYIITNIRIEYNVILSLINKIEIITEQLIWNYEQKYKQIIQLCKTHNLINQKLYVVLIYIIIASKNKYNINNFDNFNFHKEYPEFYDIKESDKSEYYKLKLFSFFIKIILIYVPPIKNKLIIIDLVTLIIEGSTVKYITGSGQKPSTQRRVYIYEKEGNITPTCRPIIYKKRKINSKKISKAFSSEKTSSKKISKAVSSEKISCKKIKNITYCSLNNIDIDLDDISNYSLSSDLICNENIKN